MVLLCPPVLVVLYVRSLVVEKDALVMSEGDFHISKFDKNLHAFYFISNTFISNARLKFANFQNLSRKILRTEL